MRAVTSFRFHRLVESEFGYLGMLNKQITYDAPRIIGLDLVLMQAMGSERVFMQQLDHAGKLAQGIFIARKKK